MERQGIHIVHLEVGEPDFDAPACVKEAACRALDDGYTHYTHSMGNYELREAIAVYYRDTYGVQVQPDQIIVTSGSSPAILLVFSTLLDPGDEVIISDPHYACYPNFIKFVQGKPVTVPVFEKDGFQYRPEAKRSLQDQGDLHQFASNPTGNLLSADRMRSRPWRQPRHPGRLRRNLPRPGLRGQDQCAEFTDRAFVERFFQAFRDDRPAPGYVIAPPFIRPMQKLQQNFHIRQLHGAEGGVAARNVPEDVARMVYFERRRKFMIRRLKEIGLGITVEPTGAFYVFANAKRYSTDSYRLAFDILEKAHVGVSPGIDFGRNGEGYLRFSYANSKENIAEGLNRLETYFHNYGSGN
jgi:aspartate/methionine/tyrosine aminotransferase